MSRFIEPTPQKPGKETKPVQKFGGKGGRTDYSKLSDSKKIISPHGGKR